MGCPIAIECAFSSSFLREDGVCHRMRLGCDSARFVCIGIGILFCVNELTNSTDAAASNKSISARAHLVVRTPFWVLGEGTQAAGPLHLEILACRAVEDISCPRGARRHKPEHIVKKPMICGLASVPDKHAVVFPPQARLRGDTHSTGPEIRSTDFVFRSTDSGGSIFSIHLDFLVRSTGFSLSRDVSATCGCDLSRRPVAATFRRGIHRSRVMLCVWNWRGSARWLCPSHYSR